MAVYYICSKEVETKKGDRLVAFLMCRDGYGSPVIRSFWLESDSDFAETFRNLMPGVAVRCQTEFGNERNLAFIEEQPDLPILDLTAFLDTEIH